jgi:hypothetical protein
MSLSITPAYEKEKPAYVPEDADFYFYRIKDGESLGDIAAKFNVPAQAVSLDGSSLAEAIPGQIVEINLKSYKNSFC